jgi:hypothetical protein
MFLPSRTLVNPPFVVVSGISEVRERLLTGNTLNYP